jgi:hypothetical protein
MDGTGSEGLYGTYNFETRNVYTLLVEAISWKVAATTRWLMTEGRLKWILSK